MSTFPTLKSGAVFQYPARRGKRFQTWIGTFLDGSQQRHAVHSRQVRQWSVQLEALDESEVAALDAFFAEMSGQAGSFEFTDPWDGTVYHECHFSADTLTALAAGPHDGRTQLTIESEE